MTRRRAPWSGRRVLITAGPTREYLDPIRFLTNASSGKMGFALADAARRRGASVTVIAGPCSIPRRAGLRVVPVVTALDMRREVGRRWRSADVVIGAAAVGDWRFASIAARKIKRGEGLPKLRLVANPDIIGEIGRRRRGGRPVVVGFALETDRRTANAREKMRRKGLDLIVANGPRSLSSDEVELSILRGSGVRRLPRASKNRAASAVLRSIEELF